MYLRVNPSLDYIKTIQMMLELEVSRFFFPDIAGST